jgi:hypothetical protein
MTEFNGIKSKSHLTTIDKIFTYGIFLDWMTYENILFLEPEFYFGKLFLILTYSYKLFFPFLLLFYAGLPGKKIITNTRISIYLILFSGFLLWGLIPTIISGVLLSWLKLIPVFVLFVACLSFFTKQPYSFIIYSKCMIFYIMIALMQYLLVYTFKTFDLEGEQILAGPYGLFGNIAGKRYLPTFEYPIIRLAGFWKEPSNASGSAFASFFLGRFLINLKSSKALKISTFLCFVSGLLTLSNAGYLAIGTSILVGILLSNNNRIKLLPIIFGILFIGGMLWLSLFSRTYFANQGTEYELLLAITGSTSNATVDYDPSAGRFELMEFALKATSENIIGAGIQPTDSKGLKAPANAPLFWFVMTGFFGLFFLLLMQISILGSLKSLIKRSPNMKYIALAFIAIFMQQLIYGSWMDANFIILTAALLVGYNYTGYSVSKSGVFHP